MQPPMLSCSYKILKSEILRFFQVAKELVKTDFAEAEKIIFFTTNNMFRQYIAVIENNPSEIIDFQDYIDFVNATEWKTCKIKISIKKHND